MYEQRIETVHHLLGEMGLTQMVVSDPRSIQYLTGAYVEPGERFLALVITKGKAPVLFLNRLFTAPEITSLRSVLVRRCGQPAS